MRIAVAGATGVLGSHVQRVAEQRGHVVVPLARSLGVDLVTGDGLRSALDGADVVVDATSTAAQSTKAATTFFTAVTETLLAAEIAADVAHHVLVSIVGIEDVPLGYYRGKVAQERAVEAGGVPWSILRATQFHEFADRALDLARIGPISFVPRMATRTVAAAEVALAVVEACEAAPGGRLRDLGGPEDNDMVDLARRRAPRRLVLPLRPPGAAGRALARGALRPKTGRRGTTTFDEWLRA